MTEPGLFARRIFRFSLKTTVVCTILALLMLWASLWQWHKHLAKLQFIEELNRRLAAPVATLDSILQAPIVPDDLLHRRVSIRCTFDFAHEMILRNRRYNDRPGAFAITPCALAGRNESILVSRGFIPYGLTSPELRKKFQASENAEFTGLIKLSTAQKMFAPRDPPSGAGLPWVDGWLRVDIPNIQKQITQPLLPFYVELMDRPGETDTIPEKIIESKSGRDEMFLLTPGERAIPGRETEDASTYPIPVYDTVASPGRHLGYVFEWALMALITTLIGVILQFRRPKLPRGAD